MNIRQRKVWLLSIIAIFVIIMITLVAAPNNNRVSGGSTYSRNPDGYGAWYEYMLSRGTPIQRWQKPLSKLIDRQEREKITFIQIYPKSYWQQSKLIFPVPRDSEKNWIKKGNNLLIMGIYKPATAATFNSLLSQGDRQIKIATTRREKSSDRTILGDDFGAVVWEKKIGAGKIIYTTTPHLAANAYQDSTDNYEFLAELASENSKILVDEYIHGYKDREIIVEEEKEDLFSYLAKTPLFPLAVQLLIVSIVASITVFRRFGQPNIIKKPVLDNTIEYIQALSGVLTKANCIDFVVTTIAEDEQLKLRKNLGLGQTIVDEETLIAAWTEQTGNSSTKLRQLLQKSKGDRPLSDKQLANWVQEWQQIFKDITQY